MLTKKRTPKQWVEYLSREEEPVTLEEFTAGCLSRILGATIESATAERHQEGILGALDKWFGENLQGYATTGVERAALDAARNQELGKGQR